MFFRSLKFRAGARQIQFRRGPDHGAAMVSSARMTQLGVGKSSWGHGGRVCRVGWSLYKVNVRTTSLVANQAILDSFVTQAGGQGQQFVLTAGNKKLPINTLTLYRPVYSTYPLPFLMQ